MNIEMLLDLRKRDNASRSRADAAFVSTLFDTQRLRSLTAHRSDDFQKSPATLSTKRTSARLDRSNSGSEQEISAIAIPLERPRRRKPLVKKRAILWFGLLLSLCLNVTAWGAQQVKLAWDPSQSPGVAGYIVHCGTSSGNYTKHIDVGTNVSATITGLVEGQTNYFAVSAYNSAAVESEPSAEIQYLVPGILQLTGLTPQDARIRFIVAPFRSYAVQATTDFKSWTTIWETVPSSSNGWVEFVDPNAAAYAQRFYRVVVN